MAAMTQGAGPLGRKKRLFSAIDLMIIPGMVYILINNYIPMAGILIAFKKIDYAKGIFRSGWIGLDNFKYLFTTRDAFIITRNTIFYNAAFIVLGTILGLIVGIFLSEITSKAFQKMYQTIILLPQLFSILIVAYIVLAFLSNEAGFINKTILGPGNEINFYGSRIYWPFILTFVYLWKGLGYNSIIYLSAIVSVDKNLYEAATVDGVGRFKQIFHVTIPCIKPTIITLVLIGVGRIFYSDFGLFLQVPMNSGQLFNVTNTIDTFVYRSLLQLNNIGMASAAATYQAVVGFIIIFAVNMIVRKVDKENALF
jgi:putative aldouronate transport system permease protein